VWNKSPSCETKVSCAGARTPAAQSVEDDSLGAAAAGREDGLSEAE
jgi:hypothetical protein